MTDFGASSNSSESEIFFRMTDRLQMESCAMAVVKDGKSVVISSKTTELIDHFGAAFIRRLKRALPDTPIEVFMPPDTEAMLDRFNKLLTTIKLDEATKPRGGQLPEKIWVVHDANALATHELDLFTRLILQFPGAGIGAVLMFASESAQADKLATQNKQFVSWALELPTPEQKLSAIQQARKEGNEEAAVEFFNKLAKASTKKTTPLLNAAVASGGASKAAAPQKDKSKNPKKSKKWTWILAVSALLLSSMGVAAILHPELSEKVIAQVSGFYDDVVALGSSEKKKTAQNNATKAESVADNKLETNPDTAPEKVVAPGQPKDDANNPPPPGPPADLKPYTAKPEAPVATPQVAAATPPVAAPAPAKPSKVITELPEVAVQGRLWLRGLPEDTFLLEHGVYETVRQAQSAVKAKAWLANARIVPMYQPGKDDAKFAVLTGPFRSRDRAKNTMVRLNLPSDVTIKPQGTLLSQSKSPQ
jgi:hypothetical protein